MEAIKILILIFIIHQAQGSIFSSLSKFLSQEKTCEKAKWCSTLLEKCNEPLINQATCCYYCPLNATTSISIQQLKTTTMSSTTTTIQKPTGGKITEIIGSGSNSNEIFIIKSIKEKISKECLRFSKNVGYPGCDIVETCKSDSDCLVFQKCCLQNCVRKCV